jgi:hypothetical protein
MRENLMSGSMRGSRGGALGAKAWPIEALRWNPESTGLGRGLPLLGGIRTCFLLCVISPSTRASHVQMTSQLASATVS